MVLFELKYIQNIVFNNYKSGFCRANLVINLYSSNNRNSFIQLCNSNDYNSFTQLYNSNDYSLFIQLK